MHRVSSGADDVNPAKQLAIRSTHRSKGRNMFVAARARLNLGFLPNPTIVNIRRQACWSNHTRLDCSVRLDYHDGESGNCASTGLETATRLPHPGMGQLVFRSRQSGSMHTRIECPLTHIALPNLPNGCSLQTQKSTVSASLRPIGRHAKNRLRQNKTAAAALAACPFPAP
jgi:hypothetical protein